MMLGVALVVAAAAAVAYPLWWNHRAATGGHNLLHGGFLPKGSRLTSSSNHCTGVLPAPKATSMHLAGIIEVPSLALTAPVLQGLSDPVLNVAVGHDPATPWPGRPGESIVEAHDVSYFSGIAALKKGDTVVWRDACHAFSFRVVSTQVTTPGVVLDPPTNDKGLALITCYPTNALFWTPDRYVVETALVSTKAVKDRTPPAVVIPHLSVPAPPDLVAQGLTLPDNPILLDSLQVTGSPAASWREGPAPLDVEAAALESYFGAEKAIARQNQTWWRDLSVPGLAMAPAWSNDARVSVAIDVSGTSVASVTLSSSAVRMRLVVQHNDLLIAQVTVT